MNTKKPHDASGVPGIDAALRAGFRPEVERTRRLLTYTIEDYESATGQVAWPEHARGLRSLLVEFPSVECIDDETEQRTLSGTAESDATAFRSEVERTRRLLTDVIARYESAIRVRWQEHARDLRSILAGLPNVDAETEPPMNVKRPAGHRSRAAEPGSVAGFAGH